MKLKFTAETPQEIIGLGKFNPGDTVETEGAAAEILLKSGYFIKVEAPNNSTQE